jgi:hypothetical protein
MKTYQKIRLTKTGKIVELIRLTGNGMVVRHSEADYPSETARQREQWLPYGTSYTILKVVAQK